MILKIVMLNGEISGVFTKASISCFHRMCQQSCYVVLAKLGIVSHSAGGRHHQSEG